MTSPIYEGPQTGIYSNVDQFSDFIEKKFSKIEIITAYKDEISIMLPALLVVAHYRKYHSPHIGKDITEVKLYGNENAFNEVREIILNQKQ